MDRAEHNDLPKIAIIGRPNVGKSSIFNRILGRRKAIVESAPGVTRDRLYARIRRGTLSFILIDTGGIISSPKDKIAQLVYKQSRQAIDESDAIIFVCDLSAGITYQDEHITQILKRSKKKVFLVVNKVDRNELIEESYQFYKLGLRRPYSISAFQNRGFDELYKDIITYLPGIGKQPKSYADTASVKIAVVGRPNVGKSSFINCIVEQERLLVDEAPGTTRDSVDVRIRHNNQPLTLIDTAGMRHKSKIKQTVEIFSLARAKESVRRCDIALVMIDAMMGLCREDMDVIDYVIKEGKPCILLVNKIDLLAGLDIDGYKKELRARFKPLEWIPVIFTSVKDRKNIIKAIDIACKITVKAAVSIPTPKINEFLTRLQRIRPHPRLGNRRPKIFYATQTGKSPPTFLLFVTDPRHIKAEYLRFIENNFRREFGLEDVTISFKLRAKG